MAIADHVTMPTDVAGYDPTRDGDTYVFDENAADLVCDFFESCCTHVKGRLARQPYELSDWERDFLRTLFGWRHKDGRRRYREALVAVARKNSKTTLMAGLALFLLLCDGEQGGEIYCAASGIDQAALLFDVAMGMVNQSPEMSGMVTLRKHYKRIIHDDSNSFLRAIPANVDASHGFNASAVIIDELHAQPSRDLYDVLKTSMGSRQQPLLVSITTAGHDRESICYEVWDHARKVRDGIVSDPTFLPVIYEVPEEADWENEENWQLANPNLGRSIDIEYLREQYRRAKQTTSYENTFRRLHLNQWTDSETRWIGTDAWQQCRVDEYPDLDGNECYIGVDLASTEDITAVVALVCGDDGRWYVIPSFFVPEDTIRQRPKRYQSQYRNWRNQGHIIATDGATTDYEVVRNHVRSLAERYNVTCVAFDPWQARDMANILDEEGYMMVEVRQNFAGLAPGVKAVEEAVLSRTLAHDGNPVLNWMIACTILELDGAGNKRPNKRKSHGADGTKGKIDGVVALVMAAAQIGQMDGGDAEMYV